MKAQRPLELLGTGVIVYHHCISHGLGGMANYHLARKGGHWVELVQMISKNIPAFFGGGVSLIVALLTC